MKVYDIKEKVIDFTFEERDAANVDNLVDLYNYLLGEPGLEMVQILECKYITRSSTGVLYLIKYV